MRDKIEIVADRIDEIEDFLTALDEWGCTDPVKRRQALRAFLISSFGITQYLDRDIPEKVGHA